MEPIEPELFARRMRERRTAIGLSQEGLARLADCSTATIVKVEWLPSRELRKRIDRALSAAEGSAGEQS